MGMKEQRKYVPNPILDPDTLTVGEMAAIEEITGLDMAEQVAALVKAEWSRSPTVLLAVMLIQGRRDRGAGWSLEDAASITLLDVGSWAEDDQEEKGYAPAPEVFQADLEVASQDAQAAQADLQGDPPSSRIPGVSFDPDRARMELGYVGDHRGHCHHLLADVVEGMSASVVCCLPLGHTGDHVGAGWTWSS